MKYMKWIWNHLMMIRSGFQLAIVLLILESFFGVASVYVQKYIIDDLFMQQKFELLPVLLSVYAVIFICSAILFVATPYTFVRNEYIITKIMTKNMFSRLFRFPISTFQKERAARFVQNLNSDVLDTGSLVSYLTPTGIRSMFEALIMLAIVGYSSLWVMVCVLAVCLLYIGNACFFAKRIKGAAAEVLEKRTELTVHLEEGISSTREVVAFHRTEWEANRYQALFQTYFDAILREGRTVNLQTLLSAPLRWGVAVAVVAVGGYQLIEGRLSLGTFVVILQLVLQIMDKIHWLFDYVMMMIARFALIDRIEAFNTIPQIDNGTQPLSGEVQSIQFRNVSFAYEDKNILNGLTAVLPVGKKIAFVGASGGGKSTVAQLLTRFYNPSEGEILVNGVPLTDIRRQDWMSRIGIVFQEPYLLADTIRQNVLFGREDPDEHLTRALQDAQLLDTVMKLPNKLDETIGERGIQLSGGQRQRLALARAMLRDPDILILDEATSALDLETERKVQQLLDDKRSGRTTIIIAHRLSTVMNADIIFVMKEGQVVEQGTHEELLREGDLYPELVRTFEREAKDLASA
ncbi:ATP-binding cassette subfamily B protein/subfamily B ATP-binding cassette protein MsbA [Paenibacillus forsythiae]|uniref:ATP-binding cassette subfamily B protein/subfamily B ATP-binding cassette protein MsbA n=1 Tax=Paenibacillus forsythiae TaxID=365616 RepID=A0ABU3H511_9BACL|nr:ABC transporter ATP-binding protein [Paenibacillus forsythiae]MDT3425811.1 ATP-binding cassette subfamily B protein/subfamily B ATP-binding cassette protein MsbA [Paenibacillus forsythiae]